MTNTKFTHIFITTQSDLVKYNGNLCYINRELIDGKEYDKDDVGLMYEITLEGGVSIHAFADELKPCDIRSVNYKTVDYNFEKED